MAITDPHTIGIECRLTSVGELNEFLDDIDWWRRNVHTSDSSIYQVIDRTPLSDKDKAALRADFDVMGGLVRHVLLDVFKLVAADANGVVVTWNPVPVDGQPSVIVSETNGTVAVEILLCDAAPPPAGA